MTVTAERRAAPAAAAIALFATLAGAYALSQFLRNSIGVIAPDIAPLALHARRFAPDRFALLAGLHMSVGTLGTLLATAPRAAVAALGWRAAFLVVAAVMGVAGLLIALVVRDQLGDSRRREPGDL
jgi:sugar phosphate permease